MLDVTDRLVVIIGGGTVAARKARGVLEAGATRVRCVSPAFDAAVPEAVERVHEAYEPRHLDGAGIVFAATDLAAVNDAVVRDASGRGVLVNRADYSEEQQGDFAVPAKFRRGPAVIAVATGGSPALAVTIRDGLAERWDPRWSRMAELMLALRRRVIEQFETPAARRDAFRALSTDDAMGVLDARGVAGVMEWLAARHPTGAAPDDAT
jgi:precorrin-2 dehydrogenase/sirohydrochlorin ferrochelatase